MRVGIIAEPFVPVPPPQYGGTELVIDCLIAGLQKLGHEVTLFAAGDSTVDCRVIPTVKKAIYFAPTPDKLAAHEKRQKTIGAKTQRLVLEHLSEFDVIHSHGFDLSFLGDFPSLTTLHNPLNLINMPYYLARQDLRYVSISRNQQQALPTLRFIGTVYNGEMPEKFPFVEKPEPYLCFLGRFDRQKNPHLAIQLALSLDMPIKIAGKIDYLGTEYFETEIKPYIDHPLVEFLGEIGFEKKIELLSHAACNLHPTNFREPFGLTVLEAAYCGTPTLATHRGSMPELIEEHRTGLLIEDFVEGYGMIEECLAMNRQYISERARMLFNYEEMARGYEALYEKIIQETAAPVK